MRASYGNNAAPTRFFVSLYGLGWTALAAIYAGSEVDQVSIRLLQCHGCGVSQSPLGRHLVDAASPRAAIIANIVFVLMDPKICTDISKNKLI